MDPVFPALPGWYRTLFLYIEPVSTISPAVLAWLFPGPAWFHDQLIPSAANTLTTPIPPLDARTTMAITQLANCYLLLGLISSLVFRAVRDALPGDPVAQERIMGASLAALAIADVISFINLPSELKFAFAAWNPMTHGNITFVIGLLAVRLAWFAGIGRTRYYYGQGKGKAKGESHKDD
ncbi:hypothetical protein BJ138DRAFT_1005833 [Hygrophoropsis aurantiaca]|uniref:Uncharacterized protein n=1 Tax=Hygrophoropsis aurantiaca TaxID=72124 RepID=A0ACB8AEW9_9AGAM|nr:hypothetical protein BJ138DRAFT_1005833 [Hygrophoropsis aurantiaca]